MTGRRIYSSPEEGRGLKFELPGDYGCVDVGELGSGEKWWYGCLPNWVEGNIMACHGIGIGGTPGGHTVIEHEDGTITVSPSILWGPDQMPGYPETHWHGFLERGIWREC
jgi:hypothetical protein